MEGLDEEQICGHQANKEGSSSIQKPDRTQGEHCADYNSFAYNPFPFNVTELRTNLFEEGGNDGSVHGTSSAWRSGRSEQFKRGSSIQPYRSD